METPLALYRRYRPETFAEVIGQDHVTTPLRAALANNRVNHAYLFSGPRGCGKTTSARILARALNCERAPIADPCGECESCRDLSRGGSGSIDVIEIDAASHGGVDDARDLREKAFFAPVKSRYKVYIIDEAHMVSTQGFNALLKLVEEPPEHLRFIFATTEPEKVIPTIRSRTHHYPFRLIPPRLLSAYLGEICEREGVAVEPAAMPLIVRAGGGSARDTMSVMDQLLGGAGPAGVTYDLAAGLLGYTPDTLLDEAVDAFAARDGASVFGVVDKVIETGQDPRRFTEDLLRRLRDLVIISAVPGATATGLIDVASDAGERLESQARRFGAADLSRAADLVASGLTEMRGATAPRLLLELICARVLLPGADGDQGFGARLDRLENQFASGRLPAYSPPSSGFATPPAAPSVVPSTPPPAAPAVADVRREEGGPAAPAAPQAPAAVAPPTAPPVPTPAPEAPAPSAVAPSAPAPSAPAPSAPAPSAAEQDDPWGPQAPAVPTGSAPRMEETRNSPVANPEVGGGEPGSRREAAPAPVATPPAPTPAPTPTPAQPGMGTIDVRRLWPEIVDRTKSKRRVAWMHLTQNCQVLGLEGDVLTLGFINVGSRDSFDSGGYGDVLQQAVAEVVPGVTWRINAIVAPSAQPGAVSAGPSGGGGYGQQPQQQAAQQPQQGYPQHDATQPAQGHQNHQSDQNHQNHHANQGPQHGQPDPYAQHQAAGDYPPPEPPPWDDHGGAPDWNAADAAVHADDEITEDESLSGAELLERELGATVIEEIPNQ
ncbi:DNA polymerase III subunit gamma and tau [Nocardioides sp.]|uniref:DNA polymerase III subunit gamma and tau n=1 Tax=Nocardioides sp. TaxID=35761 RepID=UPI0026229E1E|nr:DNA polymerase III subunit gamma and tau [Nocardioides sp.]